MIRTEFTLTVDDFLDWQKLSQTKRTPRAPAIVVLCGFFLVLIGYILARGSSECMAQFGVACLFAGLLATVSSVPLWYILQRTTRKERPELQRALNKFYGERRIFEASESGWKYSTGTKDDSRQWSDLFRFVRTGQTLVLMDPFHSYPLPISALTVDQLKALEQLGKKSLSAGKLFSVPMVASAADFMIAQAKHNWLKKMPKMLFFYSCGLLVFGSIALALADSFSSLSPWLCLNLLFLPAIEGAHYHSLYRQYWQRSFQDADILQHAICFNHGTLHNAHEIRKLRYEWFDTVVETKRSFMLYFRKDSFFLIPKPGLTPDQLAQIHQLLTSSGAKPW